MSHDAVQSLNISRDRGKLGYRCVQIASVSKDQGRQTACSVLTETASETPGCGLFSIQAPSKVGLRIKYEVSPLIAKLEP